MHNQMSGSAKTLYDKLWDAHFVCERSDGATLLYIDRHLIHEVTSPQAFSGLRACGRDLWRRSAHIAMPDHAIPTEMVERNKGVEGMQDPTSKLQTKTLHDNCDAFGVTQFSINDARQGIVHVSGPEQGLTLPGMTVVCGDSHTSTHGALGALAIGIGTSEVEHVLATQCLATTKTGNMLVRVEGQLGQGVSAKDLALAIIGQLGTDGGTGCTVEFSGPAISALTMEGRMTLCNMAVEMGSRSGLIAVDDVTLEYTRERPYGPSGAALEHAQQAWSELHSDTGAVFDKVADIDASKISAQISWGTSPEMVVGVDDAVPDPARESNEGKRESMRSALEYMGLEPGTPMADIPVDQVFIGSCTNGRIEDLRIAAEVTRGHKVAKNIKRAMVVPGSAQVRAVAEAEGLDKVFLDAGIEWRAPGCSMCLAMNNDRLDPRERCATTSNRNFEGRQGYQGRSHLMSPATAAATAISGHFQSAGTLS
jgi:3-isopropylmalate/(R)-2-methylmalate dehydratase large subunit